MKKTNILFFCSWGGFGHISRALSVIKELPKNGTYTVVSPEKWPFSEPLKNFKYIQTTKPKSRIRFQEEDIVIENYTPKANDTEGYKKFIHELTDILKEVNPQLVVVDNPAEIAIFCKIMGYKTVVVYESLDTNDLRWRLAWKNVDKVLSPYPKEFMEIAKFPYIKNTFCSGGFTRYDGEKRISKENARKKLGLIKEEKYALLTMGKGRGSEQIIKKVAGYTKNSGYTLLITYPKKDNFIKEITKKYSHVSHISGVYDTMNLYLSSTDIVITGSGYNSVMEVCHFQKPAITIPLKRIYNEQLIKSEVLSKMNAVVSIDPSSLNLKNFSFAIEKITSNKSSMEKSQKRIVNGNGAKRAADMLLKMIK